MKRKRPFPTPPAGMVRTWHWNAKRGLVVSVLATGLEEALRMARAWNRNEHRPDQVVAFISNNAEGRGAVPVTAGDDPRMRGLPESARAVHPCQSCSAPVDDPRTHLCEACTEQGVRGGSGTTEEREQGLRKMLVGRSGRERPPQTFSIGDHVVCRFHDNGGPVLAIEWSDTFGSWSYKIDAARGRYSDKPREVWEQESDLRLIQPKAHGLRAYRGYRIDGPGKLGDYAILDPKGSYLQVTRNYVEAQRIVDAMLGD